MASRGGVAVVLAWMVTLLAWSGAVAAPRFTAPVFSIGDVSEIAVADLNGDGKPDVAAADVGGTSVLHGRGDGRFDPPTFYPNGIAPVADSIVAADVSGDGAPDLISAVTTDYDEGWVDVLLNDGAGRFRHDHRYELGSAIGGLVAADLDGDALLDIVIGQGGGGFPAGSVVELSVLIGTGGGQFASPRQLTGNGAADVAVGDFNGDGRIDVVLSRSRLALRLGNGDGTFAPARWFGPRDRGSDPAVADLNHDGKLDVVAGSDRRDAVYRLLGNGDGTFGPPSAYAMARWPVSVALADLDDDGHVDMAVNDLDRFRIVVRSGRGNGTFGRRQVLPWDTIGELVVADVNLDGRPDLVTDGGTHRRDQIAVLVMLNSTGRRTPCVVTPVERARLPVARREIERARCRLARVRYRYSSEVRRNRVISQRPRYGTVLPSHASVHLVVSRGRRG